jgi:hypothetical protein
MKAIYYDPRELEELSSNCHDNIASYLDKIKVDNDNQTITYKGKDNLHYANQKLIISLCKLAIAERNLRVSAHRSDILKQIKKALHG